MTAACGWHDVVRDDDHAGRCGWCGDRKAVAEAAAVRYASVYAWRRVRGHLTESEAGDVARDVAGFLAADGWIPVADVDGIAGSIAIALVDVPWSDRRQA